MDPQQFLIDYYAKITSNKPAETRPLSHILQAIKGDTYQKKIEAVRAIRPGDLSREAHTARAKTKQALPYITISCTSSPTRSNDHAIHNGTVNGDLDNLTHLADARSLIEADPLTLTCFLSPSGLGLKVVLRVPTVADKNAYKAWWDTAAAYHQAR